MIKEATVAWLAYKYRITKYYIFPMFIIV